LKSVKAFDFEFPSGQSFSRRGGKRVGLFSATVGTRYPIRTCLPVGRPGRLCKSFRILTLYLTIQYPSATLLRVGRPPSWPDSRLSFSVSAFPHPCSSVSIRGSPRAFTTSGCKLPRLAPQNCTIFVQPPKVIHSRASDQGCES
jgi:hypothetical protein